MISTKNFNKESTLFYNPVIHYGSKPNYNKYSIHTNNLITESFYLGLTGMVVDHYKHTLLMGHFDPQYRKLFGDLGRREMPEENIKNLIAPGRIDEFKKIIYTINYSIQNDSLTRDRGSFFSFNFPLIDFGGEIHPTCFKVIPYLFFPVISNKNLWLTYYLFKHTDPDQTAILTLHSLKQQQKFYYLFNNEFQGDLSYSILSEKEVNILRYCSLGYDEQEIAAIVKTSSGMVRNMKSKVLFKMKVGSTPVAVTLLKKAGLL